MKILFGHDDVNPDRSDKYGQTPLYLAARGGYEGVVEVLLGGADSNTLEISVQTPLPAELGPLPLYLDNDGFYSVLGPPLSHATREDQENESTNDILAYNASMQNILCGSSKCPGTRFAPPSALFILRIG